MGAGVRIRALILILTPAFIFSCASGASIINNSVVIDVPFYKQSDYECGPASLASVLNYWHRTKGLGEVTLQEIINSIYSPYARGTLGIDLELYARNKGFTTLKKRGSIEELKRFIDSKIPPIILVTYGFYVYELDHFLVVKGYNEKGIIVNSRKSDEFISYEELERIWKKTDYWMLIIVP
ncbi:MAG: C39 family peptidase [Thermodesulfovibrionales bacterium]|nr:C39 family peptidase [Thermodesulfovibrionales bacterium]